MYRIVASITSLQQHLDSLANNPVIYRPRVCPHCSFGRLWCHGCYERKADRPGQASDSLNPIPIPRYLQNRTMKALRLHWLDHVGATMAWRTLSSVCSNSAMTIMNIAVVAVLLPQ